MFIFPCNLFSAFQLLLDKGRIYTKTMAIYNAKDVLISGILISQEGLKLRLTESGHLFQIALLANTRPKALPIRLQHLRLGYKNIQDIRKTVIAIIGMKLNDPDPTSDFQCHIYELSKSHLQINKALRKILDFTLNEIFINIIGFITLISFNGHRYIILITD